MIVKSIGHLMRESYGSNGDAYIITELGLRPSNTIVLIANILTRPNSASTIVCYATIDECIPLYQHQHSFICHVTTNIIYNTYMPIATWIQTKPWSRSSV